MLLEYNHVGELFTAYRTGVDRRLGTMDAHVGLEIAFRGEGTAAEPTAERSLAGVRAIVHQQCTAAAQSAKTHCTLVGVELT